MGETFEIVSLVLMGSLLTIIGIVLYCVFKRIFTSMVTIFFKGGF